VLGASHIAITLVPVRDAEALLREDIARVCVTAPDLVAALNRLVRAHGNNDRFKHEPDMVHCAACRQQCTGNPDCLCGCDKD
jgi:D-serine deaminase-like pyridoxal phosphate-dependent protein